MISSTPFARIASRFSMKPGRWLRWQVGVKAPGMPTSTILRPAKSSPVVRLLRPALARHEESGLGNAVADGKGHGKSPAERMRVSGGRAGAQRISTALFDRLAAGDGDEAEGLALDAAASAGRPASESR